MFLPLNFLVASNWPLVVLLHLPKRRMAHRVRLLPPFCLRLMCACPQWCCFKLCPLHLPNVPPIKLPRPSLPPLLCESIIHVVQPQCYFNNYQLGTLQLDRTCKCQWFHWSHNPCPSDCVSCPYYWQLSNARPLPSVQRHTHDPAFCAGRDLSYWYAGECPGNLHVQLSQWATSPLHWGRIRPSSILQCGTTRNTCCRTFPPISVGLLLLNILVLLTLM